MNLLNRRPQAHGKLSRTRLATRVLLSTAAIVLLAIPAHAVIIRGRVTDALGKPVPNARVQLIEKGNVAAIGFADSNGAYEIRSADSGRFTLLGSAGGYLPAIGHDFYGGATDVLPSRMSCSPPSRCSRLSASRRRRSPRLSRSSPRPSASSPAARSPRTSASSTPSARRPVSSLRRPARAVASRRCSCAAAIPPRTSSSSTACR